MIRKLVVLAVFALAGCGGVTSGRDLEVPNLHDAAGLSTCSAAKDPLHPLVVEWPSESRTDLEAVAAKGPVVVSYAGCDLKVLRACHVREATSYQLVSTTPAEQKLELTSSADLYANLPLSAVSLEGKLAQSGGFSLTYVAVGERVLDVSKGPTVLEGECDGASHYVDAMVVGAFDLTAHADRATTAKVSAFHGTAGGDLNAAKARDGSAGDIAVCKEKGLAAGASCQAILSLALTPLRVVSHSPLAVIPALGELRGKGELDIRLLELIDAARKLDADGNASSRTKANAWNALAAREGPYQVAAARRRDDWLRVAAAQDDAHAHVLARCSEFVADRAQNQRVLALDDRVMAGEEKRRLSGAFEQKYGTMFSELRKACAASPAPRERSGMALIPAGSFEMGVAHDRVHYINYVDAQDAGPPHRVAVAAFALDLTEVTVGDYRRCLAAGKCTAPAGGKGCTLGGAANLPINCVDQPQARAFCNWAAKRLPTEEEWEYAARPNGGPLWPWGSELKWEDELTKQACYRTKAPCPVGTKAGNSPFGVADMAGNVWEWTSSNYSADYSHARVSSEAVIRGGSYESPVVEMLHATYREPMDPARRVPWVGFRCAKTET